MKKFHTLPGVIPRVGVAEGRGAFARWSFTAGAALLLLLSAEGAQGAGADPTPSPTPTPTVAELDKRARELNTKIELLKQRKREIQKIQETKFYGKNDEELQTLGDELTDIDESLNSNSAELSQIQRSLGAALYAPYVTPTDPPVVPRPSVTPPNPQVVTGTGGTANNSGGNSTKAYASDFDAWKKKYQGKRDANKKEANADPCYVSSELGEDRGIYKCAGTQRALDNSQQITAGAVVVGTVGMAMKNQNAVNDALKSGSQSGNLDAQASIQSGQEDISKTIGAIQMTQALMLKSKADSHGKNIRQLEGNLVKKDAVRTNHQTVEVDPVEKNPDATAALQKFVSNESLTQNVTKLNAVGVGRVLQNQLTGGADETDAIKAETATAVANDLNAAVKFVGQAAVAEQKNIQKQASEESMKMFQQAAVAFTVAEQARKNKEILRQTAQSVKQVEKSTKDLAFQFAPNDRSPNQLAAPNQSLSLSSAQDASQSKTDGLGQNGTDDPTGETPNFGSPFGAPNDPIPQPSPQPVGEFQRNPNGGGGGGGGGAGGGTSTQPSSNDDDHGGGGGSTYYKLANNKDQYSAGGGGVGGSGGGGGNAGMDFTGMLSQFLPKAEDQGPKNGILDFGARAPAQTALPSSLLDASANLFERVHEAYQSKNRKGQVGQAVSGGKNP
jgi:hypothetical protein